METDRLTDKKEFKTFHRRRRPPPSLSSSSSSVPLNAAQTSAPAVSPLKKKTRDLPNFSECHACGFRVDVVEGRSRLNSLYSEWRIVLLCKKCFSLVESSQVCSYCFAESVGDCFNCCECNRRVHRECFSKHSRVAPWSYSSNSEFSVCIDCWVPKPIITARAISRGRKIGRKNFDDSHSRSSKVSTGGNCTSLSDLVKDANSLMEKKIDAAARAREQAVKKAAVARRAAKLASEALNLVAQCDENIAKESGEISDDVELAIQLHRTMNSSSRFSKNLCSLNTDNMTFQNTLVDDGDPAGGALYFLETPEVLANNNICRYPDNAASEPSVKAKDHVSTVDIKRGGCKDPKEGIACLKVCESGSKNVEMPLKHEEASSIKLMSSDCNEISLYSESQWSHKQAKCNLPRDERCIAKPNHYFFKYRRRDTNKRYLLKYSKRNSRLKRKPDCQPDILVDGLCLGVQSSSAGILFSGSEELSAISNASLDSCPVPVQASGYESSSGDL